MVQNACDARTDRKHKLNESPLQQDKQPSSERGSDGVRAMQLGIVNRKSRTVDEDLGHVFAEQVEVLDLLGRDVLALRQLEDVLLAAV